MKKKFLLCCGVMLLGCILMLAGFPTDRSPLYISGILVFFARGFWNLCSSAIPSAAAMWPSMPRANSAPTAAESWNSALPNVTVHSR